MDDGMRYLAVGVVDWHVVDDCRVIVTNVPVGLPCEYDDDGWPEIGTQVNVVIDDESIHMQLAVVVRHPNPHAERQEPSLIWKVIHAGS